MRPRAHTQTRYSLLFFFHFEAVPKLFLSVFRTVRCQRDHAVLDSIYIGKPRATSPLENISFWAVFAS